ncbi:hypothetical protein ACFXG1_27250 [Streptomyces sp. NPDC059248]|uniref:hypothetical protein n=1 Tax=Streptomyces sp. NPDC059248 TaxID=3346791 RepID=UPI00369AF6C7
MVAALARRAADFARQAGHPVTDPVRHQVEQVLYAVLADPEVADLWFRGLLVAVPRAPSGFKTPRPRRRSSRPSRTRIGPVARLLWRRAAWSAWAQQRDNS